MRSVMGSRRGVSPLIAAVLLIAFTMAVAAILTAWVTTFTQQQTETIGNQTTENIECSFANLEILSVDWNTGGVTAAITNSGNEDFTNVSITVFEDSSVLTITNQGDGNSFVAPLTQGQTASLNPTVSGGVPNRIRVQSLNCPAVSATESQ